jgi:hypothetical protein
MRMSGLKDRDINFEQIVELVRQLEFEKQMALIKAILSEKEYREHFYQYSEDIRKKHQIPSIKEEELNAFLQDENKRS